MSFERVQVTHGRGVFTVNFNGEGPVGALTDGERATIRRLINSEIRDYNVNNPGDTIPEITVAELAGSSSITSLASAPDVTYTPATTRPSVPQTAASPQATHTARLHGPAGAVLHGRSIATVSGGNLSRPVEISFNSDGVDGDLSETDDDLPRLTRAIRDYAASHPDSGLQAGQEYQVRVLERPNARANATPMTEDVIHNFSFEGSQTNHTAETSTISSSRGHDSVQGTLHAGRTYTSPVYFNDEDHDGQPTTRSEWQSLLDSTNSALDALRNGPERGGRRHRTSPHPDEAHATVSIGSHTYQLAQIRERAVNAPESPPDTNPLGTDPFGLPPVDVAEARRKAAAFRRLIANFLSFLINAIAQGNYKMVAQFLNIRGLIASSNETEASVIFADAVQRSEARKQTLIDEMSRLSSRTGANGGARAQDQGQLRRDDAELSRIDSFLKAFANIQRTFSDDRAETFEHAHSVIGRNDESHLFRW